jgi:hypothetical protein
MSQTNFTKWFKTFLQEKELDLEATCFDFKVNGLFQSMPLGCIVEFTETMPKKIQNNIKTTLVKIDFKNGNIKDYLEHLAKGIVHSQN